MREKLEVVAPVRLPLDTPRVKLPTVPLNEQPEKVAIPLEAVAVSPPAFVQLSAAVPDATAKVTGAFELVTVLLPESRTVTTGCVVKATPLIAPEGWVVTASLAAAPKVRVIEFVVVLVRLPLVAVRV